MKVLLLNQVFHPDHAATAQHLTDLAIDLTKEGHRVTVIAARSDYNQSEIQYPKHENYLGVKICRVGSAKLGKKTILRRVFDAGVFYFNLVLRLIFTERHDVVIGLTSPPLISFFGVCYCKIHNSKFLYWVMDLNPDLAIIAGVLKKKSIFSLLLEKISRLTLRSSDCIVALDSYMAEKILSKDVPGSKIKVLPPWALDDDLYSVSHHQNSFRDRYNLNGKFVVMYSGNHSIAHPLDTVLESAKMFIDNRDIQFIFIGGGVRTIDVTKFKKLHNLSNIMQLPYQSRQQLAESLSAADVHVATMGNEYVGVVHPCKVYGILAVERPFIFIGPKNSHIGNLVKQKEIGYQIEHGTVEKFVEIIFRIQKQNSEEKEIEKFKSRKILEDEFSHAMLSRSLIGFINKLA
jgi:colanic acid biosynthesis glycosyl transferase WcaI